MNAPSPAQRSVGAAWSPARLPQAEILKILTNRVWQLSMLRHIVFAALQAGDLLTDASARSEETAILAKPRQIFAPIIALIALVALGYFFASPSRVISRPR